MTPWPLPLVFAAWGTAPGQEYDTAVWKLTNRCKAAGVKTVAVELGYVERTHVQQIQAAGMKVVAWNVVDSQSGPRIDALGVDGLMPQIEGPGQRDGCFAALRAGVGKDLPKAIVTTYTGLENYEYKELQKLGVTGCFVECYAAEGAVFADLDRMQWQGTQYGVPAADFVPVCSTYRGELPPAYSGLSKRGRSFGLYLAEPMSDQQWTAWGGVAEVAQVYYWRLVSGANLLHEERATTYPDGTDGLGRMLDWERSHKDILRASPSVLLQRVLMEQH